MLKKEYFNTHATIFSDIRLLMTFFKDSKNSNNYLLDCNLTDCFIKTCLIFFMAIF